MIYDDEEKGSNVKGINAPVYDDEKSYGNNIYGLSKKSTFITGQYCDPERSAQYYCKKCKGRKFYVGYSSYYTVIKCIKCNIEVCVHGG